MIREATTDDLKALAALYKELMTYHHNLDPEKYKIPDDEVCEKKMQRFIDDNTDKYGTFKTICHETNSIIDGYAVHYSLSEGNAEKPDGSLILNHLFVTKTARRKGIGTEIMRELLKIAKETYFAALSIEVHVNNDIARQFYKKLGLVPRSISMEMRLN